MVPISELSVPSAGYFINSAMLGLRSRGRWRLGVLTMARLLRAAAVARTTSTIWCSNTSRQRALTPRKLQCTSERYQTRAFGPTSLGISQALSRPTQLLSRNVTPLLRPLSKKCIPGSAKAAPQVHLLPSMPQLFLLWQYPLSLPA